MWVLVIFIFCFIFYGGIIILYYYRRGYNRWFPHYVSQRLYGKKPAQQHLLIVFNNIYNPSSDAFGEDEERALCIWEKRLNVIALHHQDSDGLPPVHSIFVPASLQDMRIIRRLHMLSHQKLAEIGLLLFNDHHYTDTHMAELVRSIALHQSYGGFYHLEHNNKIRTAWAYSYAQPRADALSESFENDVFLHNGCFADFSPRSLQQHFSNLQNLAYCFPCSKEPIHDQLIAKRKKNEDINFKDFFMRMYGAVGIAWCNPHNFFIPQLDNGEIHNTLPPTIMRTKLWIRTAAPLPQQPHWLICALWMRGGNVDTEEIMLGNAAHRMFNVFEKKCSDYYLHYVSVRELYNIILAAAAGMEGNPHLYRNWLIPPTIDRHVMSDTPFTVLSWTAYKKEIHVHSDDALVTLFLNDCCISYCTGKVRSLVIEEDVEKKHIAVCIRGTSIVYITGIISGLLVNVQNAEIINLVNSTNLQMLVNMRTEVSEYKKFIIQYK